MNSLTSILSDIEKGDRQAVARLFSAVYEELRRLAESRIAKEQQGHTLQATGLVHEVFLRLSSDPDYRFTSRQHFFAAAAQAMRRILVDHARAKKSAKRGGDRKIEPLPDLPAQSNDHFSDILSLNEAMIELEHEDPRKAKLVELRFFAGLTLDDAAAMLDVSLATAKRDWAYSKAWLYERLNRD